MLSRSCELGGVGANSCVDATIEARAITPTPPMSTASHVSAASRAAAVAAAKTTRSWTTTVASAPVIVVQPDKPLRRIDRTAATGSRSSTERPHVNEPSAVVALTTESARLATPPPPALPGRMAVGAALPVARPAIEPAPTPPVRQAVVARPSRSQQTSRPTRTRAPSAPVRTYRTFADINKSAP